MCTYYIFFFFFQVSSLVSIFELAPSWVKGSLVKSVIMLLLQPEAYNPDSGLHASASAQYVAKIII